MCSATPLVCTALASCWQVGENLELDKGDLRKQCFNLTQGF